jgi:hypothetical protein
MALYLGTSQNRIARLVPWPRSDSRELLLLQLLRVEARRDHVITGRQHRSMNSSIVDLYPEKEFCHRHFFIIGRVPPCIVVLILSNSLFRTEKMTSLRGHRWVTYKNVTSQPWVIPQGKIFSTSPVPNDKRPQHGTETYVDPCNLVIEILPQDSNGC